MLYFINFLIDRLKDGVTLYVEKNFCFQIDGYLLMLGWILETVIPIWFINKAVSYQANYPFSEISNCWYKHILLIPKIEKPTKKEILDRLDSGDISCLLEAIPAKISDKFGWNFLAIYWESKEKKAFLTLCTGGRTKMSYLFGRICRHLNSYWSISAAEAERIAKLWGKNLP